MKHSIAPKKTVEIDSMKAYLLVKLTKTFIPDL